MNEQLKDFRNFLYLVWKFLKLPKVFLLAILFFITIFITYAETSNPL